MRPAKDAPEPFEATISDGLYEGNMEVTVEMDPAQRIQFQSEGQVKMATLMQYFSRLVGVANQLGLQGRVITTMDMAQPLVPYRQTGRVHFKEVSNGQLKKIRRQAAEQAQQQLRESDSDHGTDRSAAGTPGEESQDRQATESQGPRESDQGPGSQLVIPFSFPQGDGGDSAA
jgi:hypothetical protein